MNKLFLLLGLLILDSQSYAQEDHAKELGLDLKNESDLAVYTMLYQIGIKERLNGILGDESCIDVNRDSLGNTNLSFGMKTDAFETGTVSFSKDNERRYKHINGTLKDLFSFFKEAKYNPKIAVRSYADPQHNQMSKYALNSSASKKYANTLFDGSSNNDPRFDTDSKRRNYLLAYDRGEAFIDRYFPEDMKGKIKTTPYNSANLEVGNSQRNSKEFACPNRRSIVVDMKFNPNLKIQSTSGAFTPAFKVADGASNHENILAAIFDAKNKKMSDLPLFCQNRSTQEFLDIAKERFSKLENLVKHQSNIQAIQSVVNTSLTEVEIERDCNRTKTMISGQDMKTTFEQCRKLKWQLKESFVTYSNDPSEKNLYNLMANMTVTSDRFKARNVRYICRSSNRQCEKYKSLVGEVESFSKEIWTGGRQRNSSHFLDCFSNKLYYEKEFKNNAEEYLTPVVDMRNPQTGEMAISYSEENVPNTKKGRGFLCQACGNGLKLQEGKLAYSHRANSRDHASYHKEDSFKTYEGLHKNTDPKTMFLMGHQKGLSVYIVKDCKVENLDEVAKNSQMVNLEDLKRKKVKVGPNDCIFKPKVINSCVHMPNGASGGEENHITYVSQVPSMLTGKNLEVALETNVSILNSVLDELKSDFVNTCEIGGERLEKLNDTPKKLIDGILCKNRGIHIPKDSFDASSDCPEIASRVLKQ